MNRTTGWTSLCILAVIVCTSGCESPSHADKGALLGGLGGAGVGALVGNAMGNTGAGAAIGAGVGALSGAAIGAGLDDVEAKNRAMIEARLGRPLPPGSVTIQEVLTMTQARVDDNLIINHIRAHGMVAPPTANDLIVLQQQGVSPRVVMVMQEPRPAAVQAVPPQGVPPGAVLVEQPVPVATPVIVGGYYGRPYYWHPHRYYW